jgi:hypothetical protein
MFSRLSSWLFVILLLRAGTVWSADALEAPSFRVDAGNVQPLGFVFDSGDRPLIVTNHPRPGVLTVAPSGKTSWLDAPLPPDDRVRDWASAHGELWLLTEAALLWRLDVDGVWHLVRLQESVADASCRGCASERPLPMGLVSLGPGRAVLLRLLSSEKGDRRYRSELTWIVGTGTRVQVFNGRSNLAKASGALGMLVREGDRDGGWTLVPLSSSVHGKNQGAERRVAPLDGSDHVVAADGALWFRTVRGLMRLSPAASEPAVILAGEMEYLAMGPAQRGGVWALVLEKGNHSSAAIYALRFEGERLVERVRFGPSAMHPSMGWHISESASLGLVVYPYGRPFLRAGDGWIRYALGSRLDEAASARREGELRGRLRTVMPWLASRHPFGLVWMNLCLTLGLFLCARRPPGTLSRAWKRVLGGMVVGAAVGLVVGWMLRVGANWSTSSSSLGLHLGDVYAWLGQLSAVTPWSVLGVLLAVSGTRKNALGYCAAVGVLLVLGALIDRGFSSMVVGLVLASMGGVLRGLSYVRAARPGPALR